MRMRKIMMGLALLATISAGAQELTSGIDRNNMNLKVKPGNDFYEYAAGGWMKSHPLDAEHADNGAFTDLFELSQEQVRGLILGYADGKQPQVLFVLAARVGRMMWTYEQMPYAVILKHAGILTQSLYLIATAMGLGGVYDIPGLANVSGSVPMTLALVRRLSLRITSISSAPSTT